MRGCSSQPRPLLIRNTLYTQKLLKAKQTVDYMTVLMTLAQKLLVVKQLFVQQSAVVRGCSSMNSTILVTPTAWVYKNKTTRVYHTIARVR